MTAKSSVRFWFAVLVGALLLAAAGPAHASADVPVTFDGGTPEEQRAVADVLSWPELPPLTQPITVVIADTGMLGSGALSLGGCSGISLGRYAVDEFIILHEYGHVFDCQRMNYEWRTFVSACADMDCRTHGAPWKGGPYADQPEERWAQSFAAEIESRHYGRPIRSNIWGLYPPKLVSRVINALIPCDWRPYPWGCG